MGPCPVFSRIGLCLLFCLLSLVFAQLQQLGGNEHIFTSTPLQSNSESPFRITWTLKTEKLYANQPVNASFGIKQPSLQYDTLGSVECDMYYGTRTYGITRTPTKTENLLGKMLILRITEDGNLKEATITDPTLVYITCVFHRPKIYIEAPVFMLYTYSQTSDPTTLPITSGQSLESVHYPAFSNMAVSFMPNAVEMFTNMTITYSHNSYYIPVGTGLSIMGQTGVAYFSQPDTGLNCWVNNTQTVVMTETGSRITLKMPFEVKGPSTLSITCSGLVLRQSARGQYIWVEYFYTQAPAAGYYFGGESVRIAADLPTFQNLNVGFYEYVDVVHSGVSLMGTFSGSYANGLGFAVYGGSQQLQLVFPAGFKLSHPPVIPTEIDVSTSCKLTVGTARVSTSLYVVSLTAASGGVDENLVVQLSYGFTIPAKTAFYIQCTYIESTSLVRRPEFDMIVRVLDVKRLTNTIGVSPIVYFQNANRVGAVYNPTSAIGGTQAVVSLLEPIVGSITTMSIDVYPLQTDITSQTYSFKFAAPVHLQASTVCTAFIGTLISPLNINNANVVEYDVYSNLYYYTVTTSTVVAFLQNSGLKITCTNVAVNARLSTVTHAGYFAISTGGVTVATKDNLLQPTITMGTFSFTRLFNGRIGLTDAYVDTVRTLSIMFVPTFSVPVGKAGFLVNFPSQMKLSLEGPSLPCTVTSTSTESVTPVLVTSTTSTYFFAFGGILELSTMIMIECEVLLPPSAANMNLGVQFVDRTLSPPVNGIPVNTTLTVTPITNMVTIGIQTIRALDENAICTRGCSMTFTNPRPNEITDLVISLKPMSQGLQMLFKPRTSYFTNAAFNSIMSTCVITGPAAWSINFNNFQNAISITRGGTFNDDATITCKGLLLTGNIAQYKQNLRVTDSNGISLVDSMTSPSVVPRPTRTTMEFGAAAGQDSNVLITMYNAPSLKATDRQQLIIPLPLNTGIQALAPGITCSMVETETNSEAVPSTTTSIELSSLRHKSDTQVELFLFFANNFANTPGGVLVITCTGLVSPTVSTQSTANIVVATYTTVTRKYTRYTSQYTLAAPTVVIPSGAVIGEYIATVVPASVKAISDPQSIDLILAPLPMMLPAKSEIILILPPTWNVPSTVDEGSVDRCVLKTGSPEVQYTGITKARRLWDSRPLGYGKDQVQERRIRFQLDTTVEAFTGITKLTCSLVSIPSLATQSQVARMRILGPDGTLLLQRNNIVLPVIFHEVEGHQFVEVSVSMSVMTRRTTSDLATIMNSIAQAVGKSTKMIVAKQSLDSGNVVIRFQIDLVGYDSLSAVAYLNENKPSILAKLQFSGIYSMEFNINYIPSTCTDNRQNDLEVDVDCGGSACNQCGLGNICKTHSDCRSLYCNAFVCSEPSAFVTNSVSDTKSYVTVTCVVLLSSLLLLLA